MMIDDIGPLEHREVNRILREILSKRLELEDRKIALAVIDEFIRCYPLRNIRESKYICRKAFDKLDELGLVTEFYWTQKKSSGGVLYV